MKTTQSLGIGADHHAINGATVAVRLQMTPRGRARHQETDTLFMGGAAPDDEDRRELAAFALRKNYNVVFVAFEPQTPTMAPIGIDVVVTDGETESIGLRNGRLWKSDRRSPAVIVFPKFDAIVGIGASGRLDMRAMTRPCHDQGFEFASEAIRTRPTGRTGGAVVAPVGKLVTVFDAAAFVATFAAA